MLGSIIHCTISDFGPMVSKHSYKEQDLGRAKLPPKFQLLKMFIGYHLTVQINMVLTNMKT